MSAPAFKGLCASLISAQIIFVFNKGYFDYNVEDVLKLLHVEPSFQPSIEGRWHLTLFFTPLTFLTLCQTHRCYCHHPSNTACTIGHILRSSCS